MLVVISPAKTLDYDTPPVTQDKTLPGFLDDSQLLIDRLRDFSALDIAELMKLSMKLAELNFDRYHDWSSEFTTDNAKQAVLAMKGDVYTGLDAETFDQGDFDFAQQHLRILSGLYGILRPLDLMQPYRLEMGTRLSNERGKNLYEFWGDRIVNELNRLLSAEDEKVLVNLASNEYFKSVRVKQLEARLIVPQFKDYKNGDYKMIGFYAKRARGMMSRYIIQSRLQEVEGLKEFEDGGYGYQPEMSDEQNWVFTRRLVD